MELGAISILKEDAALALRKGREPKTVILYYAGMTVLVAAALTVMNYWLSLQIDNNGGLGNLGTRTMLSTAQAVLPLVQWVVLMGLDFGYLHAMMRISRRQYADQTDLKVGFQKFFPLVRLVCLQGMVYFTIAFLTYQVAAILYMLTPWAKELMALVAPMVESGMTDPMAIMTEEFLSQATGLVVPMMVIFGILYCALMIPVNYRLRFAQYALLDDGRRSAFAAIRASLKMTHRNCGKLFRLDLSFWWYYLLYVLVGMLSYLDLWLSMLGIVLPMNGTASYFLCYGIYLAALFAMNFFLRNRVECTYIMAYESVCEKPKDSGVVLGNIFDM